MDGNTDYFFLCSQEYPSLARSELEHASKSVAVEIHPGLYKTTEPVSDMNKLGFCKAMHKVLTFAARDTYDVFTSHIQNSYKLELYQDTPTTTLNEVADTLHDILSTPHVDIHTPKHVYVIFLIGKTAYLTEKIAISQDTTHTRSPQHKKHLHPTSLDPKIAKAMLVLSDSYHIHDPFCGVGGIVAEGVIHGYSMTGSDIDAKLVTKANENIGVTCCTVADATTLQGKYDALVSDLPYGKNSALSSQKMLLYEQFFSQAKNITRRLVLGSDIDLTRVAKGWKLTEQHVIYVHKSLNRILHVFTAD